MGPGSSQLWKINLAGEASGSFLECLLSTCPPSARLCNSTLAPETQAHSLPCLLRKDQRRPKQLTQALPPVKSFQLWTLTCPQRACESPSILLLPWLLGAQPHPPCMKPHKQNSFFFSFENQMLRKRFGTVRTMQLFTFAHLPLAAKRLDHKYSTCPVRFLCSTIMYEVSYLKPCGERTWTPVAFSPGQVLQVA